MKKMLAALGLALLILIAVVLVRTAMVQSRQLSAEPVTDLAVDTQAAAARLAGAIRFPTISHKRVDASSARRSSACINTWRGASRGPTRR